MTPEQGDVLAWHEAVGHPAPRIPTNLEPERALFRAELLREEGITEYLDAVKEGSLVEVADALGDALWIVYGTAVEHGIDLEPIFSAIANSNFSKLDASLNPVPHPTIPGKIGKSDRYQPPTEAIHAEIELQMGMR